MPFPEIKIISDAINSMILKANGGEITRDDLGDVAEILLMSACKIDNALIDTLPQPNEDDGKMAFADLLFDLSEQMRENGGKVIFDG